MSLSSAREQSALVTLRNIRNDAAWVMSHARDVHINVDMIAGYARELVAQNPIVVTELDPGNHFVDPHNPVATATYVVALDSINFGSGVFHIAQRDGVALEYHVVAQGLKRAFESGKLSDIDEWQKLTAHDCHQMFDIPNDVHPALSRLMAQFAEALQLSAKAVKRDFGSIKGMLDDFRGQGLALFDAVAQWSHFADVATYDGRNVAIYKRAQIMLTDLELALAPGGVYFGGLGHLTCFADNMVPHVLRADGVLRYSEELAGRIDGGAMIEAGSSAETELRCAAIHAVELLRASLGGAYTAVNLDHMLWHRGYLPGFSELIPHRTVSNWY